MAEEATKWEYKVISKEIDSISYETKQRYPVELKNDGLESELNSLGSAGWELVTAQPTSRGPGHGLRFILKRPKRGER